MILEKGNMWTIFFHTDIFVITTNPIIRNDGAVVMGRGIALEAKARYPTLPYDFGKILKNISPGDQTNVGCIGKYEETPIWFFMVKDHWRNEASLKIIEESVFCLKHCFENFDQKRIDINFPGIGNGKLKRNDVLPLLEGLSDNVHVWEYE